ncbi:MAG: PEGA domain-containing protein, partial [Kofleriaceae bacterium]|nr:PEGA domain-containing protein [Kofleriaceae bacterium]
GLPAPARAAAPTAPPAGRGRAGGDALGVAARDPGLAELADGEPTTAFLPSALEHDETIDRAPHLRAAQAIGTVRLELPGSAAAREPTAPMAPPVAVAAPGEATVVAGPLAETGALAHATAPGPASAPGPAAAPVRPSRPPEPVRVRPSQPPGPLSPYEATQLGPRPAASADVRKMLLVFAGLAVAAAGLWLLLAPGRSRAPDDAGLLARAAAVDASAGQLVAASPVDAAALAVGRSDAVGVDAAPARAVLEVITSPPGAEVQIGGARARAPAQFTVDPGIIELEIHLAGHVPAERRYEVAPGERRTVEIALRKASAGAPAASGRLTLRTDPYAEVYLGSRHLGQTPFAELVLPAGTHTLVLQHPGKKKVTRAVTIKPGQETRLFVRLP